MPRALRASLAAVLVAWATWWLRDLYHRRRRRARLARWTGTWHEVAKLGDDALGWWDLDVRRALDREGAEVTWSDPSSARVQVGRLELDARGRWRLRRRAGSGARLAASLGPVVLFVGPGATAAVLARGPVLAPAARAWVTARLAARGIDPAPLRFRTETPPTQAAEVSRR